MPNRTEEITDLSEGKRYDPEPTHRNTKTGSDAGDIRAQIVELKSRMKTHAQALEFEKAAQCRDMIKTLEREFIGV